MDRHLPEGGLARGALHEIRGGGADLWHAAAAAGFAAGILARLDGPVLWCLRRRDLYAPGLAGFGLAAGRVIHAEAPDEAALLAAMEEGLRHAALAAVLGELALLPRVASRRLTLAAARSGVMAIALQRPSQISQAQGSGSAAATRWCVTPVPQSGAGGFSLRWHVALTHCRGGNPADWILEACDAQGHLAVPAALADRPVAPDRPTGDHPAGDHPAGDRSTGHSRSAA